MTHSSTLVLHDETVRVWALGLTSSGFDVRARIEGWFEAPDYIYGYRPDIVASKDNHFIIVEVKKGEADWPKITALERYQREHENFRVMIILPGAPVTALTQDEQR